MLDHFAMLAIFATAITSVESEHIAESFDIDDGAPQEKDFLRNPSCIGSASYLFRSFFHIAHDEQDREGVGDARSASSAARTTMCTVGNYFWLSVVRSSGAGRGDCRRGCVLTSRAGGAANS